MELKLIITTPDDFFGHPQWRMLMTALSDLQAAVAALQGTETDVIALINQQSEEITNLLAGVTNADDAQVEASAQALVAINTQLQTALTPPTPSSAAADTVPGATPTTPTAQQSQTAQQSPAPGAPA